MPNGHGGVPRYVSPALAIGALVVLHFFRRGSPLIEYGGYALAALAGLKLAEHIHFWHALEYDGAYLKEDEMARARRRFHLFATAYAAILVVLWFGASRLG